MTTYNIITYDAKVFAQMPNTVKSCCRLIIQPTLFLLERAMSELQILYQTYYLRKQLRKRKGKDRAPWKKFLQLTKICIFQKYWSKWIRFLRTKLSECRAPRTLSITVLIEILRSFLDS